LFAGYLPILKYQCAASVALKNLVADLISVIISSSSFVLVIFKKSFAASRVMGKHFASLIQRIEYEVI
jgi:hypothetical protein